MLFIESYGNYIKVFFIEEGKEKNQVLRSTLKRVEEDLSNLTNMFKCHRAYIVNTSNIINVSGNAQGYKLKLKSSDYEVPVARSYIQAFNKLMG